jgi:hypothetical protein
MRPMMRRAHAYRKATESEQRSTRWCLLPRASPFQPVICKIFRVNSVIHIVGSLSIAGGFVEVLRLERQVAVLDARKFAGVRSLEQRKVPFVASARIVDPT